VAVAGVNLETDSRCAEVMRLASGGPAGTTLLRLNPRQTGQLPYDSRRMLAAARSSAQKRLRRSQFGELARNETLGHATM